jgi:UDP-N-acetylmuramoylalanine--D-glutamate ligase
VRDDGAREIAARAACPLIWTSRTALDVGEAVFWRGDELVSRLRGAEEFVLARGDVRLLGSHALWNVASAAAAALVRGVSTAAIRTAVGAFTGLPHRLCPVGTFGGVLCVDDSKSTTPAAAALALEAFDAPVRLLAGGYDKGLDPASIVHAAREYAAEVVCFGGTREALAAALRAGAPSLSVVVTEQLTDAVRGALARSAPGDVLLLSPGHASWDQFQNYEERGRVFATAVRAVHSAS